MENTENSEILENIENIEPTPQKRPRGRPKKEKPVEVIDIVKRPVGRPRKIVEEDKNPKKKRIRHKKVITEFEINKVSNKRGPKTREYLLNKPSKYKVILLKVNDDNTFRWIEYTDNLHYYEDIHDLILKELNIVLSVNMITQIMTNRVKKYNIKIVKI